MVGTPHFSRRVMFLVLLVGGIAAPLGSAALAVPAPVTTRAILRGNVDRPLRYAPDGRDFVIRNGPEFFNRPLYGGNTAFRADAGDRPEVSLYLPGRGGNLRFGIVNGDGRAKWLHEAKEIEARYRPGSMLYEIRDGAMPAGMLRVEIQGMRQADGVIARVELAEARGPIELLIAFGGVSGERGRRNGDIGTESEPVSRFFQLRPEQCAETALEVTADDFVMTGKAAVIVGTCSAATRFQPADATHWNDLPRLLASAGKSADRTVVLGRARLEPRAAAYLSLQRLAEGVKAFARSDLSRVFDETESARRAVADRVVVDTPDAHVNAAAAALCIAADATWDDRQKAVMHGAVAWRSKLLGWRGVYWCDALGRHDLARQHLANWFPRQNVEPIPEPFPPPAEAPANLSRNETALHSNGDLTESHYDMNMVAIDALLRHLMWTGDVAYARQVWPVIERHLAWEHRLFRRSFGQGVERAPLYEAYANNWASDAVGYNGGGVTQASATNLFHNRMAAEVARLIGQVEKGDDYDLEADLIAQGMRQYLWLDQPGCYAESKDLLGLQTAHDNPALWTFYQTIDSGAVTRFNAWQMSRHVGAHLAHIPVANGAGGEYVLPTSNWMPYVWSINNVVLAENAHAALAFWQAGRGDEAFKLFKGAILTSMYAGLCPGNVGMAQHFDAHRGESQRDFADGAGALSRSLVEGLFGFRPNALAGEIVLRPGFPPKWDRAAMKHPDLDVSFERKGSSETYRVELKGARPLKLLLHAAALRDDVAGVWVNEKPAKWTNRDDEIGSPRIEVAADAAKSHVVRIEWRGETPAAAPSPRVVARMQEEFEFDTGPATPTEVWDPQQVVPDATIDGRRVRAIADGGTGHRTLFTRVRQGGLKWWVPLFVEVRPPIELRAAEEQPADGVAFAVRNNLSRDVEVPRVGRVAARSSSDRVVLADGIMPGTNRIPLGDGTRGEVVNWRIAKPPAGRMEPIELRSSFNDRVTQIFRNEYLSPRSPHVSLAVPKQGYGNWCKPAETFAVDDSGLRRASSAGGGKIVIPPGIPFATPGMGDEKNVMFTSRWDHYPVEASVSLGGRASHVYLLMAGSTNPMQSRFDNGEVIVSYADTSIERLVLRNPTTWWPIDQDYFIDDFAFRRPEAIPPRMDLQTGKVRIETLPSFKGRGGVVEGGAATVLDLPLDPTKQLKSLTVRTLANEVVIGLMAATVVRPE